MVSSTRARSRSNASLPAALTGSPAATPETDRTIASYHDRTVAASVSTSPSASATTATASGPATVRRSSAAPWRSIAPTRRSVSFSTNAVNRARASASPNARSNGCRCRRCASPSSDNMLGPTTRAVENLGSSTVKASASRITCSTRSRRVTSQPPSAGSHETGSSARSRASTGWGSDSSAATLTCAPSGKRAAVVTGGFLRPVPRALVLVPVLPPRPGRPSRGSGSARPDARTPRRRCRSRSAGGWGSARAAGRS